MTADDLDDAEECAACGGPAPPGGGDLCPGCEDLQAAARTHDYPPGGGWRNPPGRGRSPPHGNTTR